MLTRLIGLAAVALVVPSLATAQTQGGTAPAGGRASSSSRRSRRGAAQLPALHTARVAPTCRRARPTVSRISPGCTWRFRCRETSRPRSVPMAAPRGPNRANGEFSYSLNERPKLPEGAIVRPAGVDPADGKIPLKPEALTAAQGDHRQPGEDRASRWPRALPGARSAPEHRAGAGGRLPDLPEAGLRRHLLRAEPPLSDDPARRACAARSEDPEGDGRLARPLGRQRPRRRSDELHQQPREQLGDRRGLRDARHSGGVAGDRPRHSAQRRVPRDRTLHADRREHDSLRGGHPR